MQFEININNARADVAETYKLIRPIVQEVVSKHSKQIDDIIHKIGKNLDNLTNKDIHMYMLQLQIETYEFAQLKDWAFMKQECAAVTVKNVQANSFNGTSGTQAFRSNQALIDSLDNQVVQIVHNSISNLMKTKLDEAHRMINVLSNVLISKNAEAKLLKGGSKDGEDE